MKEIFVTVHGVGETAAGQTILGLSKILSNQNTAYVRNDLVVDGQQYARLQSQEADQPDLIEVNWSDVERPSRSAFGVLSHWLKLSFAILHLGAGWPDRALRVTGTPGAAEMRPLPSGRLFVPQIYQAVMEAFAVWVVYPVLLGLGWMTLDTAYRVVFVMALLAVVGALSFLTWSWSFWMRCGGLACTTVLLASTLGLILQPSWGDWFVAVSTWAYCSAQYAILVFLALITIELICRLPIKEAFGPPALSCLAMNYLPLLALSIFGAVVWAIVLNVIARTANPVRMQEWATTFLKSLFYDLMWVEWVTAGVTAGIAVFCGIGAALYFWRVRHRPDTEPLPGRFAQNLLLFLLRVMPVMLVLPAVAMFKPPGTRDARRDAVDHVVEVYTVSATRAVPVLGLLVTPFAIVLHVLGDVVLYIAREDTALSAPTLFKKRLAALLQHLNSKKTRICILAHSQGSVIALDVIQSQATFAGELRLLTMGSPLEALYVRFLGCRLDAVNPTQFSFKWRNIYRSGDYVGGRIDSVHITQDKPIGEGGHVGYWSDPRIVPFLDCTPSNQEN